MLYLRFKTKETAQEFKEKFETCQEQLGGEADRSKDATSTWKDTSQDPEEEEIMEFVSQVVAEIQIVPSDKYVPTLLLQEEQELKRYF